MPRVGGGSAFFGKLPPGRPELAVCGHQLLRSGTSATAPAKGAASDFNLLVFQRFSVSVFSISAFPNDKLPPVADGKLFSQVHLAYV